MPVAPDMLLRPAAQASASSASAKRPEPRPNEASDFSEVYAKERQARPADRTQAPAEPDARVEQTPSQGPQGQAEVADDGKELPQQALAPGEDAVDPLLLDALANPAAGTPLTAEDPAPEIDPSLLPFALLPGQMPIATDAQSFKLGNSLTASGADASSGAFGATGNAAPAAPSMLELAMSADSEAGAELDSESLEALLEDAVADTKTEQEGLSQPRSDSMAGKLSALNQAITQQVNAAPRATLVPGQPVAMQQGGWSEAVVDRVMWLSSQNLKSAEIQLDPQELGRLDVRINLQGDQTQVIFASANAGVRDALESQMHRLRDMFAQQGMNQLDVSVSDQSARGFQGQAGEGGRGSASRGGSAEQGEPVPGAAERVLEPVRGRGLVDFYA
jgi:flagellar hook-length control protein FliK